MKKKMIWNHFIKWTLITIGRRFLFLEYKNLQSTISQSLNDIDSKQSKLLNFPIFSFQQIFECKKFLVNITNRKINFNPFLFKSKQRCNPKNKEWLKKTKTLSTLFPKSNSQCKNKRKDKKTFCRMQKKIVS